MGTSLSLHVPNFHSGRCYTRHQPLFMNLEVPLFDIHPRLPISMATSSSTAPKPNIGILSIGDMGMGVASLLRAHDYMIYTVAAGRR